jgi:hypothetical protein
MRRAAIVRSFAILCLAGCIGSTGYAMATFAGLAPPLSSSVQAPVWVALVLLVILLVPQAELGFGYGGMRDTRFRLHRHAFRATLTGPFAEMGRPRRRRYRYALRQSYVFLMLCLAMVSMAGWLLWPVGFWIVATMLVRYAAWEGDPVATWLDGEIGTRPLLRRNRSRDWTRTSA